MSHLCDVFQVGVADQWTTYQVKLAVARYKDYQKRGVKKWRLPHGPAYGTSRQTYSSAAVEPQML